MKLLKIVSVCLTFIVLMFPNVATAQGLIVLKPQNNVVGSAQEKEIIAGQEIFDYIEQSSLTEVKRCIKNGIDVNFQYDLGVTVLMYASYNGEIEIVKYLIDNGANINLQSKHDGKYGFSALTEASRNGHIEVVKYLIDNGADINLQINYGYTALIEASRNGHIEVIKYLIDNGADINIQDRSGKTALIYATDNKNKEIAKYLKSKGAK